MIHWSMAFPSAGFAGSYLEGLPWHSHEMMFGFVMAVMTGFLFTAVRNWTGKPTPTGWLLGAVALLWLAARVLVMTEWVAIAAIVDAVFLPVVAVAIALPVFRSRNRRNYKVVAIVAVLAGTNVLYHLAAADVVPRNLSAVSMTLATDVFLILLAIIGGRVIPAFTANAVSDATPVHNRVVEILAMGSLVVIVVLDVLLAAAAISPTVKSALLLLAAAAHTVRLWLWQPLKTRHNPLLWMLPAAYAWIPVTLFVASLGAMNVVSPIAATHALVVGAMSCMMLAMMMRSSLGHTGRELRASRIDVVAYCALQGAAILRLLAALFPAKYAFFVSVSALAWIVAFCLFLVRYVPMLVSPRVDGRPG